MSKTAQTNPFGAQLDAINKGLQDGALITTDLKVVQKHGFTWTLIKIVKTLMSPIYALFGCCDPWGSYRINNVAQAILKFCETNKEHFTDEQAAVAANIFRSLRKHAKHSQNPDYLVQVQKCRASFAKAVSGTDSVATFVPAPKEDVDAVRNAISTFSTKLWKTLLEKEKNKSFAFSPVSIVAVLGMAINALTPEAKKQMIEVLGLEMEESKVHQALATLLREIPLPKDAKGSINTAQGFAVVSGQPVAASFETLVEDVYGAEIFQDTADKLAKTVNKWVSEKTNKMIPTLLDENNKDIAVVLLNAIYLELKWDNAFKCPAEGWETQDFVFSNGTKAPVSMMTKKSRDFAVYEAPTFKLLEMKYKSPNGRELSQLIILPSDPKNVSTLTGNIATNFTAGRTKEFMEDIRKFLASDDRPEVRLSLPKIKAESNLELLETLKEDLGLPIDQLDPAIFGPGLFVSGIVHKTVVENDEEGTKAAAVTGMMCAKCAPGNESLVIDFIVDHSYSYVILDGDNLLFQGTVDDKGVLIVDKK
jgi:serine protease inhibitor